jgi:DNA-binding transcriptional ArsR family regulator
MTTSQATSREEPLAGHARSGGRSVQGARRAESPLLLQALQEGELAVGDLVARTGLSLANASKQLQQLHAAGFIQRRKDGLFVYYSLSDLDVMTLCDLMCGRVTRDAKAQERALRAG